MSRPCLLLCFAFCLASSFGCVSTHAASSQNADGQWQPVVKNPEYPNRAGPVILVDAAHGNFHTIDGRFSAFAKLLRLDGYRVHSANAEVTPELLAGATVFVISNAIRGGSGAEWTAPTPAAFAPGEIEVIVDWVGSGGSLLLIADHMPFPGATADLASEFGVGFFNGFAMKSAHERELLSFARASGLLADHAITRGRSESESIETITSFTGQAFSFTPPFEQLMQMPDDWVVLLPAKAWEFDESTPMVSAKGLSQGGVVRYGSGRVAVFGEAAMFTAQTSQKDGVVRSMGLNHPSAAENTQFVLNLMHWLTGLLEN